MKNLLLFVPLLTSAKVISVDVLFDGSLGFLGFSLICSGNYFLNDLKDIEYDKTSEFKRSRPIASGSIQSKNAILTSFIFIVTGCVFCLQASPEFLMGSLSYLALALLYSLVLKRIESLQVVILVLFYEIRILLGGILFDLTISFWLLLFSFMFFSSLAFLKVFTKLQQKQLLVSSDMQGNNISLVSQFGIGFSISSMLSFALYINSPEVILIYSQPKFLWAMVPLLQYLMIHLWRSAYLRKMHYDPIIFIIKDLSSRFMLLGIFIVIVLGR